MTQTEDGDIDVTPSDYVRRSLRMLSGLRDRLIESRLLDEHRVERETIDRELGQAETSLRRVLYLIGG